MLQLGQESEFFVGGKRYVLGRLELSVIHNFRDWIKQQLGDPFEDLKAIIDLLPKEQAEAEIKQATQDKKDLRNFSLGCGLAKRYLANEEGAAMLLFFAFKPKNPGITPTEAFDVLQQIGAQATQEALSKASGESPTETTAGNSQPPA